MAKAKAKAKATKWPTELRKPMDIQSLVPLVPTVPHVLNTHEDAFREQFAAAYFAECSRRIRLMAEFLGIAELPADEAWERFVIHLCQHWNIPGCQVAAAPQKGPGAPKHWTNQRNCELFADVMALASTRDISENSACAHISKNKAKFKHRYGDTCHATLHRQFLRVKKQIKENTLFRWAYFNDGVGLLGSMYDYGEPLIKAAIHKYSIVQK